MTPRGAAPPWVAASFSRLWLRTCAFGRLDSDRLPPAPPAPAPRAYPFRVNSGITILAPAKLNVALAVGGRDVDGYHPICSWMMTVDLYDHLELKRLPPDRFSRYAILWHPDARRCSDIDWSVTKDLAVRAHLALERHLQRRLPVQMKLEKRIPVGGGLGGGSTDAAAMLHAVHHLFELGLSIDELSDIGATLGSDVPFLVRGGSAIVEGRGEQIEHHDQLPELSAVLVFPESPCRTAEVYERFDESAPGKLRSHAIRDLPGHRSSSALVKDIFNDLAAAALGVAPALAPLLDDLSALAERPASISGSGSTIFILCDDPLHAEFLAGAIERELAVPAIAVRSVDGHRIADEQAKLGMRGIPEV